MSYNPPELWDAQQIAAYLRQSRKTILNHTSKQPGFPSPIVGTRRNRLWIAEHVVRFVTRRAA